jgi:protein involved in polysaccharide export with SLBB domain
MLLVSGFSAQAQDQGAGGMFGAGAYGNTMTGPGTAPGAAAAPPVTSPFITNQPTTPFPLPPPSQSSQPAQPSAQRCPPQPALQFQTPGQQQQQAQSQAPLPPQGTTFPQGTTLPQPAQAPATQQSIPERNEFQDFIFVSTGQRLPLFGYDLFVCPPTTFAPLDNVPVTPDYVVGPGDELSIRAWGQIDVDYRATIDRNGMIYIPRVGSVQVSGTRYQDLTSVVRSAVGRNFRNFEILVTMGQLRAVQVFVVGQAKFPGRYTVSSLSTLVNAIFAAGGPSGRGSMRSIQLKRGSRVVTELDLYDLLVSGDKSKDAPLLPGDVIHFAPVGPQVALAGSVNNPAIFELRGNTSVGQLFELAGGLATTAQTKRASIERIVGGNARAADLFTLDNAGLARMLKGGDLVTIFSISPKFENTVTLRGNVATPLRYPYKAGMRVRDLIPEKEALLTPDYYIRKNLAVRLDVVTEGGLTASVRKLSDEINWDYAVIERLNHADLSTLLVPFNLGKAILEGDPAQDLLLMPGDVVTVFSKSDVAAPVGRRSVVVQLSGEFSHAGVYQAKPGETLRQLVARAGGLTPNSYLFGAEFTRESTRKLQETHYQEALNRLEREAEAAASVQASSVVTPEQAAALPAQMTARRAVIARLRALKPNGRIVLELPPSPTLADLPDVALEDGDRFSVPSRPSMVSVFGAVFTESSFLYRPEKNVGDYLAQAGGTTKRADTSQLFVVRADGSVAGSTRSWLGTRLASSTIMPGDTIVVPEDFERTTWTRDLKDWTQILYQFGLGVAAIKVLRE